MDSKFKNIYNLIKNRRIKEAISKLLDASLTINDWNLHSEIEELSVSHNLMLHYSQKGSDDPNRENIYHQIICKAYELVDLTALTLNLQNSDTQYAEIVKKRQLYPSKSIFEIQQNLESYSHLIDTFDLYDKEENPDKDNLLKSHELSVDELFEKILTSALWSDNEEKEAQELLNSQLIKSYDVCVMISAITISLLYIFDIKKFNILLDAYNHNSADISQRAIIGVIILSLIYEERISLYPQTMSRVKLLNEDNRFINDICRIQLLLLMTLETSNISEKMRNEIIPKIIQESDLIDRKIQLDESADNENENPNWNNNDNFSAIEKIDELQSSGADICMDTFSSLKNFSFFDKEAHWFYPFFKDQKDIAPLINDYGKKSFFITLLELGILCNSDKYSFCFTVLKLPKTKRNFIVNQLNIQGADNNEFLDLLNSEAMPLLSQQRVSELYIHDLYRFFKLWKYKNELYDIFSHKIELWKCNLFKKAIFKVDTLKSIASFYLKYGYNKEASVIYQEISKIAPLDSEVWQKEGYAFQKNKDYKNAIKAYIKADILEANNEWTNHHLAQCYKKVGNFNIALDYYLKVEKTDSENLNIQLQIGYCLIYLNRYEDALKHLFKVEYLNKKSNKARRAIAWCYFLTKRLDEAEKYYKQIIRDENSNAYDFMNYSHVLFSKKEVAKAIKYYRKTQELLNRDEFIKQYNLDKEHLIDMGLNKEDIDIMPDLII